jgi:[ribosomal protein S5]-alanine N-acetyltransferase
MSIPTLTTTRLTLRPFTLEDAPRVQELAGDARLSTTTLNVPHPYPDGAAEVWISMHSAFALNGTEFAWAITLLESNELLGALSLMPKISVHSNSAELGYWLGVPYWGAGLMTEAVQAVINWGFETLELHCIFARAFTRNPASARVMKKAGMRFEGISRGRMLKDNVYEDLTNYSILRTDR